jgi:Ca2+:H+ antiporter
VSAPSSAHDGEPAMTLPHPADANPDVEPGTHSTPSVESEAEQPLMSLAVCLWLLVVVTVVGACCNSHAEFSVFSL